MMRDLIREAIATGQPLRIDPECEENMTPEDVILLYIARNKKLVSIHEEDIARLDSNLGNKNQYDTEVELYIKKHKNIFARILFDILLMKDYTYFTIFYLPECERVDTDEYIEIFTHLTTKYKLNDYLIHHVWVVLLFHAFIPTSDETAAEFCYQIDGPEIKSARH